VNWTVSLYIYWFRSLSFLRRPNRYIFLQNHRHWYPHPFRFFAYTVSHDSEYPNRLVTYSGPDVMEIFRPPHVRTEDSLYRRKTHWNAPLDPTSTRKLNLIRRNPVNIVKQNFQINVERYAIIIMPAVHLLHQSAIVATFVWRARGEKLKILDPKNTFQKIHETSIIVTISKIDHKLSLLIIIFHIIIFHSTST